MQTLSGLVQKLNIKPFEYDYITQKLGREPNDFELYLFSAMYSEHCGYKHSKKLLAGLYREGGVFCDENAGGIKIGEHTIVFKIESHNHPSAVEPFNGAATGIGGIIRDILAMNARPIALMNSLKFGNLEKPENKRLLDGVVSGISHYGNCIGVPTIGGECEFLDCYDSQPLVNVMAVGIAKSDEIKISRTKVGLKILLLGSKTGLDGLGGAAFASKELNGDEQNRLSVQIADPFMKKRLIEATLEIFKIEGVDACQDCGAAGILSSTSEIGYKSHCGVVLHLEKVHAIANIKSHEIMLSESQERMVFTLSDSAIDDVMKIAKKYDLEASIIGETTINGEYQVFYENELLSSIPCHILAEAPLYDLNLNGNEYQEQYQKIDFTKENVFDLVKSPNFASKKYIFEQYDYTVQGRTAVVPDVSGVSAIWLKEANCFAGFSMDSNPVEVQNNPYLGTFNTILESYKNLVAAGFEPKGITNCLNFGNPEKADVADGFIRAINGMNDALKNLEIPVVSGNVSFYNEYRGSEKGQNKIYPTPTIAMMGICDSFKKIRKGKFDIDETVAIIGDFVKEINTNAIKEVEDFLQKEEILGCLNITRGGITGTLFRGLCRSNTGFEGDFDALEAFYTYPNCFLISLKNTEILSEIPHKIIGKVIKSDKILINGLEFDKNELFELYQNSLEQIMSS
ncbi:MAG: phosphoribosylformylglycinamidine synthase subunit PurL [bacterium]